MTYQYRHRGFMYGGDPMHKLYMLDVTTGKTTRITDDREAFDVFSSWSPSGQWVAIEAAYVEPKRRKAVFLYEVETEELTEVPRRRCLLQRHSWRPESRHLLVRINGDGCRRLEIIRVEDTETVWSHESPKIRGGAFASDGEHFICEMDDELLWYEFPSGELSQKLPLDGIGTVLGFAPGSQISFGPDGEIYFLTQESKVYRWEMGGDCKLVVEAEEPTPLPKFTWEEYTVSSSDGFSILVQSNSARQIRVARLLCTLVLTSRLALATLWSRSCCNTGSKSSPRPTAERRARLRNIRKIAKVTSAGERCGI